MPAKLRSHQPRPITLRRLGFEIVGVARTDASCHRRKTGIGTGRCREHYRLLIYFCVHNRLPKPFQQRLRRIALGAMAFGLHSVRSERKHQACRVVIAATYDKRGPGIEQGREHAMRVGDRWVVDQYDAQILARQCRALLTLAFDDELSIGDR